MSQVTEEIRASATEIYHGDAICQLKSKNMLTEMGLPSGLLPLQDMEECGYVKDTGFFWLIQKNSKEHRFEKIGKLVYYGTEVTGFFEKGKIKQLTGVQSKEFFLWVVISDIYLDDQPTDNIMFKTPVGLYLCFPVSSFELEEEDVKDENVGDVVMEADVLQEV